MKYYVHHVDLQHNIVLFYSFSLQNLFEMIVMCSRCGCLRIYIQKENSAISNHCGNATVWKSVESGEKKVYTIIEGIHRKETVNLCRSIKQW